MRVCITRVKNIEALEKLRESPYVYLNLMTNFLRRENFNVIAEEETSFCHLEKLTIFYEYLSQKTKENPSLKNIAIRTYFARLQREELLPKEVVFNLSNRSDLIYGIGDFLIGQFLDLFEQAFGSDRDTQYYEL